MRRSLASRLRGACGPCVGFASAASRFQQLCSVPASSSVDKGAASTATASSHAQGRSARSATSGTSGSGANSCSSATARRASRPSGASSTAVRRSLASRLRGACGSKYGGGCAGVSGVACTSTCAADAAVRESETRAVRARGPRWVRPPMAPGERSLCALTLLGSRRVTRVPVATAAKACARAWCVRIRWHCAPVSQRRPTLADTAFNVANSAWRRVTRGTHQRVLDSARRGA